MCLWGAEVMHFYHHFLVKSLCASGGGGGLHCYHHFPELKFLCVGGGGGLHFYQTFTWMCSNVGLQHDMPNQTSDLRLYTHCWTLLPGGTLLQGDFRWMCAYVVPLGGFCSMGRTERPVFACRPDMWQHVQHL